MDLSVISVHTHGLQLERGIVSVKIAVVFYLFGPLHLIKASPFDGRVYLFIATVKIHGSLPDAELVSKQALKPRVALVL